VSAIRSRNPDVGLHTSPVTQNNIMLHKRTYGDTNEHTEAGQKNVSDTQEHEVKLAKRSLAIIGTMIRPCCKEITGPPPAICYSHTPDIGHRFCRDLCPRL